LELGEGYILLYCTNIIQILYIYVAHLCV
jgi:hypothetical protein